MSGISYSMPRFQAIDMLGRPMVGATLYTYQNKTTTPAPTWRDKDQTAYNTNPVVLDARGEAVIWLDPAQVYTFVLRDWFGALVWSQNDVVGGANSVDGAEQIGFVQQGIGAKRRSLLSKNRDVVSVLDFIDVPVNGATSNQEGIVAAVAAAEALKADLDWPATEGDYISTENIPGFHRVRHTGCGVVNRSGNRFTPGDQRDNTVNEIFISATGLDANDGLSSTEPTTLNSVAAYLKNYGPVLRGKWRVKLAPGVYGGLANASRISGLSSARFVEFVGPDVGGHPNVPTAHIDGSGGNSTLFVARGWGLRIQLQDIHMRETLGAAMSATEGAVVQWINVHQTNCAQGLTWGTHAECYVSGGIHRFETGFSGFALLRALFLSKHNIGYRINEENWVSTGDPQYDGPRLYGNGSARAISLSENSTGHVRSCLVDRFSVGLEALSSSRAHIEYSEFTRNSVAADIQAGANVFDNNTRWNPRGSNRNTITRNYRGGTLVNTMTAPMVQLVGWEDAQAISASGSTWKLISSPYSWDGRDNRPGMMMKIVAQGTLSGTTSTKSLRLSTNGASICSITFPAAAAGPFYVELGFIKKAGDFVLPFGFGNCAGTSGSAAGIGEAVVQYQEVNRIMDDDVSRSLDLFAMTDSTNDSIAFGTVHCYRAG